MLKCMVNLGNCKDLDKKTQTEVPEGYDSAKGMHPPWAGISTYFQEWVLKNPKKLRIKEVHLVGGTIDGNIYLPRVLIKTYEACCFKGSITAGTLSLTGDVTFG